MKHFIINILDLKDEDYELIDEVSTHNDIDFIITLKVKDHICPNCGCFTSRVKDYSVRKLTHKVFHKHNSTIYYNRRRYSCLHCLSSFVETNPFGNSKYKVTPYTTVSILESLKHYTATYTQVAKNHGVSVSTVITIFDRHVQISRKPLPEILCVDEVYFDRHANYKYILVLLNFHNNLITDIVESRHSNILRNYFFHIDSYERNNVKFIIIDMYRNYYDLFSIYFPMATIVIDNFHVMKLLNDSLNAVRKRIMRQYSDGKDSIEYRLLKHQYRLLLKNQDKINDSRWFYFKTLHSTVTERKILEAILSIHPSIELAYKIKCAYQNLNSISENEYNSTYVSREFEDIIHHMVISEIPEMSKCATTLKNWRKPILDSFVWVNGRRLSNGPIEGKNNYIKKILSNANGMVNFERARNRIIYSQNKYETFSGTVHEKTIKKIGKPRGVYKKKKEDE